MSAVHVKVAISKRARRRILAGHQLFALGVAGYALTAAHGTAFVFLLVVAVESFVFSAVYALVVAPAPKPRATARPSSKASAASKPDQHGPQPRA